MSRRFEATLDLLDLERIEVDIFRGRQPGGEAARPRVFGGQVAAQALMAASCTVEAGVVHSLHSYFLRAGDPTIPIVYEVDRIRDGRSFATRRVVAIQHGEAIFNLQASFHVDEDGYTHQDPMPDVPAPEDLPTTAELAAVHPDAAARFGFIDAWPVDMRFITDPPYLRSVGRAPEQLLWLRADGDVGDDPVAQRCMLTFISDMILLSTQTLPHVGDSSAELMMASLDHLVWFHRPHRIDEWTLYTMRSRTAQGARGFMTASMFSQSGALVASVAQEGLMRTVATRPDHHVGERELEGRTRG